MLKEQLLGFALKTLWEMHGTKERLKNSLPGQLLHSYVKNIKEKTIWNERKSPTHVGLKKTRKSSIRSAKEIDSSRALMIIEKINHKPIRLVHKYEEIDGKKSLAYLIWALGHAERAGLSEGISVHDVSSLLYHACKIELYPINISRVVFGNQALIQQVDHQNRTKTYLLTPHGKMVFKNKFL